MLLQNCILGHQLKNRSFYKDRKSSKYEYQSDMHGLEFGYDVCQSLKHKHNWHNEKEVRNQ